MFALSTKEFNDFLVERAKGEKKMMDLSWIPIVVFSAWLLGLLLIAYLHSAGQEAVEQSVSKALRMEFLKGVAMCAVVILIITSMYLWFQAPPQPPCTECEPIVWYPAGW
ncbi:hypothetical protein C4579_01285 [Candidatus Microgenomates bacterium]|nr:MAG: hypothetical protein C4579_01285 [Candidatus Microgenomates bacterium]